MLSTILLFGCCLILARSAPSVDLQQQQQQQQQQPLNLPADVTELQRRPILLFGDQQQEQNYNFPSQYFRLQQPLTQSLVPLGKIQGPNEETMILFYPNAPLTPLSSQSKPTLKQNDLTQMFLDQFWGFIQMLPGTGSRDPPPPSDSGSAADTPTTGGNPLLELIPSIPPFKPQSSSNLEFEPEAEEIPKQPSSLTPASTFPLPSSNYPNNFIYYTVGNTPQFFGNFDYLRNTQIPFFRWPETDQNNEQRVLDSNKEINKSEETKIQSSPTVEQSTTNVKSELKKEKNLQETQNKPGEATKRFSEFLISQKIFQPQPILIRPEYLEKAQQAKSLGTEHINDESNIQQVGDQQSIAQARPVAISVTGKGGIARSAPVSTAVVGSKGIALSSPQATSVSGDFEDESKKADITTTNNNN